VLNSEGDYARLGWVAQACMPAGPFLGVQFRIGTWATAPHKIRKIPEGRAATETLMQAALMQLQYCNALEVDSMSDDLADWIAEDLWRTAEH
jgi:hypothetical protein